MHNRGLWIGLTALALVALGATAATTKAGGDPMTIDQQVAALPGLQGAEYSAARNAVVAQGDAALPALRTLIAADDAMTASAALVCAGWIEHGDRYAEFRAEPVLRTAAGTLRHAGPGVSRDVALAPLMVEDLLFRGAGELERVAAVDLLERLREPRALPALDHALHHDPSPLVRMTVANALQREPDAGATAMLLDALSAEADAEVRAEIVVALGWRKDTSAVPTLLDLLGSESQPAVRGAAAQALGWIRDPVATPALIGVLAGDPDAGVRGKAALSLGKLGGTEARTALEQAAGDPDPEVVRLAGAALKRID